MKVITEDYFGVVVASADRAEISSEESQHGDGYDPHAVYSA